MVWEIIGKLFALYVVAKVLVGIWKYLRGYFFPLLGWRINYKSYGDWAGMCNMIQLHILAYCNFVFCTVEF